MINNFITDSQCLCQGGECEKMAEELLKHDLPAGRQVYGITGLMGLKADVFNYRVLSNELDDY